MYSKEVLERVIFQIHKTKPLLLFAEADSTPIYGFSHDHSRNTAFMDVLMNQGFIQEERANVICILSDSESLAQGIFFTDKALYVNSARNKTGPFHAKYDEIRGLVYVSSTAELRILTDNSSVYCIDTPMWSKRNIKIFLSIASGLMDLDEEDRSRLRSVELPAPCREKDEAGGVVYGNVSNAGTLYGQDRFGTARGHGFAAERANHLIDKLSGKQAQIVGDDNAPYGADRVVNGVLIQSKYCRSGSKCIEECFEQNRLKYTNPDGSPMQIEVPSDKYDGAIQAMEIRIKNGEVPGVRDPDEAKSIIRKGHITYEQARNIARFGTVESITFDASNGAIISTYAFGISTAVSFCVSVWNGDDFQNALKIASYAGLKVGGATFVTAVVSSQLSKAGLNSVLMGSSESIVRLMGPKASAMLVNAFRSGKNIYGAAAMKSAAKLLRSNTITAGVSIVVLSAVDVVDIFRGRISGGQLFKNLINTGATVSGGTVGWAGGATAGAAIGSVIPGIGTSIGGLVGGIVGAVAGGTLGGKAADVIVSQFIEDDAKHMVELIEKAFTQLAQDYLLNQREVELAVDSLRNVLAGAALKDMYASEDRGAFVHQLLVPHIESVVRRRQPVLLPSGEQMVQGLRCTLEEIANMEPVPA